MSKRISHKDEQRLKKARSAYLEKRAVEAISLYEKLVQRNPAHIPINMELAQIHASLRNDDLAKGLMQKLISQQVLPATTMILVGRTYLKMGQYESALRAFQVALRGPLTLEKEIGVRTEIAFASERLNDLVVAQEQVNGLLDSAPNLSTTHFIAGLVRSRNEELGDAERFFRTAIKIAQPTELISVRAWYELGHVLEKLDRFDEAWAAFKTAKQIKMPNCNEAQKKSAWMAELTRRLANGLQPNQFSQWEDTSFQTQSADGSHHGFGRPFCMLTGHPRSGTTLLEQILDCHPNISSADESSALLRCLFNPMVFPACTDGAILQTSDWDLNDNCDLFLKSVSQATIDDGCQQYRLQLEAITGCSDQRSLLVDKNPEAIIMLPVLQRAIPQTKLIVMLRDPRDVCLSCFQQYLPVNPVSVNYDTLAHTTAKYARSMGLWLLLRQSLKLDWLEVKYEDLVDDPAGQSRRVFKFLGVDWDESVLDFASRVRTKTVRSPTYHAVAKPIYQNATGRWRNFETKFEGANEILKRFVEAFGYAEVN